MAILVRYKLTSEAYREKFRNAFQLRDESFREYTVRVEGFFRHWCEREDIGVNFQKLFDLMMREKLLSGCDKDLKLWVQEHRPRNVNTLVELAESFQGARKHVQVGSSIKLQSEIVFQNVNRIITAARIVCIKKEIRTCFKCNHQGHIASYCPTSQNVKFKPGKLGLCIEQTQNQVSDEKSEGVKRYVSGVTVRLPGVSAIDHTEKKVSGIEIVDGKVSEQSVSILRDTGRSTVFVHGKYAEPAKFTGEVRMISLADGTVRECPEAWNNIVTLYITGTVLALVLESPFADLILGKLVNTSIPK